MPSKIVGYYYGLSDPVAVYGDWLDTIAAWTNWAHVSDLTAAQAEALPERARALNLRISMAAMQTFFAPGAPYTLRADWRARWESNGDLGARAGRKLARRLQAAGVLHSVYVADEPYGNGISKTDLDKVLAVVSPDFPVWIAEDARWVTEVNTGYPPPLYTAYAAPTNLAVYGLIAYEPLTLADATLLYARLVANWTAGKILVVAQAFNTSPGPAIPNQMTWYNQVYATIPDGRAEGLAWFLYPNYPGYKGSVSDAAVIADQKTIGISYFGKKSLASTQRAIKTARFAQARAGASRAAFSPAFTTGGTPGTQGGFYGWTRVVPPLTAWTAVQR